MNPSIVVLISVLVLGAGICVLLITSLAAFSYVMFRSNRVIVNEANQARELVDQFMKKPTVAVLTQDQFNGLSGLIRAEIQSGLSLKREFVQ